MIELREPLVQIDNFAISQYLTCPRKFYWRIVCGLVPNHPTSLAREFGVAIHAGLAAYYSNEPKFCLEAGLAKFTESWTGVGREDSDRNLATGIDLLTKYSIKYKSEWFDPIHVEIGFSVELSEDLIYTGRIDLIGIEKSTGNVVVVDHKTASRSPLQQEIKHRQISGYVFACREIVGDTSGGILNYLILVKDPDKQLQRKHSPRSVEQLEDWHKATIQIVRRIRESVTIDDFWCNQESCSYYGACDYLDLCNYTGDVRDRLIRGLYTESKWSPYEVEEEK